MFSVGQLAVNSELRSNCLDEKGPCSCAKDLMYM